MLNTNTDEYKKIVEKGRRGLSEVIKNYADDLSEVTRKRLFGVIFAEYRQHMQNEDFYNDVESFCAQRRSKDEKDFFYCNIMRSLAKGNAIKKAYADKYSF